MAKHNYTVRFKADIHGYKERVEIVVPAESHWQAARAKATPNSGPARLPDEHDFRAKAREVCIRSGLPPEHEDRIMNSFAPLIESLERATAKMCTAAGVTFDATPDGGVDAATAAHDPKRMREERDHYREKYFELAHTLPEREKTVREETVEAIAKYLEDEVCDVFVARARARGVRQKFGRRIASQRNKEGAGQ